ncbi:MAG: DUF4160 domain-containing protein [Chloroflexota bacterium]
MLTPPNLLLRHCNNYMTGLVVFAKSGECSKIRLFLAGQSRDQSMPTALRRGPYRFYFYSYDCDEPRRMHVDRERLSAKFWLEPDIALAANHGYSRRELRDIEAVMRANLEMLRHEWDAFCHSNAGVG